MTRRQFVGALVTLTFAVGHRSTAAAQQTDRAVILDGTLEVLIEDNADRSRILYFLVTPQQRIPLRFRQRPPQWTTGTPVRVRGVWQPDHVLLVSRIDRR